MSKYQESLDKIKRDVEYIVEKQMCDYIDNTFESSLDEVNILQQAIDKAVKYDEKETAKEVLFGGRLPALCPSCKMPVDIRFDEPHSSHFYHCNFCPRCGCKLKRSSL